MGGGSMGRHCNIELRGLNKKLQVQHPECQNRMFYNISLFKSMSILLILSDPLLLVIYIENEDCSYHNTNQKANDLTLKIFRGNQTSQKCLELLTNVVNSLTGLHSIDTHVPVYAGL